MGCGEHTWFQSQHHAISLHRRVITFFHCGKNSGQAQADDDGHFRHQSQGEMEWVTNNETANGKACHEACKCHFQNVNYCLTEGGLNRQDFLESNLKVDLEVL